jgi:N-acetyl-anhydromuramyl-L-alanine amidase AmpD
MSLTVEKRIISRNFTRGRSGNKVEYIVIHYFGSLGTAKAVANYFAGADRQASAHYCLDEGNIVYQCVEDTDTAWHCGTSGAYTHPKCRNRNSIGIEVRPYKLDPSTASSAAVRDWYFTPEIVDNLVEFTRSLMEKYGIPPENVVRHYDVTGKWCPRPFMGDDMNEYYGTSGNEQWAKFKARLSENEEDFDMDINEARNKLTSCADTGDTPSAWAREAAEYCKQKGIFNGDGAGNYGWQQAITREAVACIIYRALEAAGALGNLKDV